MTCSQKYPSFVDVKRRVDLKMGRGFEMSPNQQKNKYLFQKKCYYLPDNKLFIYFKQKTAVYFDIFVKRWPDDVI